MVNETELFYLVMLILLALIFLLVLSATGAGTRWEISPLIVVDPRVRACNLYATAIQIIERNSKEAWPGWLWKKSAPS